MEIKGLLDYKKELKQDRGKYLVFRTIDTRGINFVELVNRAKNLDVNTDICHALNSIGNQGIESIDVNVGYYYLKGQRLPISELANSEKVFLVACLAEKSKTSIVIADCITSLTHETFLKFLKAYGKSEYVNLACLYADDSEYYKDLLREVCVC